MVVEKPHIGKQKQRQANGSQNVYCVACVTLHYITIYPLGLQELMMLTEKSVARDQVCDLKESILSVALRN